MMRKETRGFLVLVLLVVAVAAIGVVRWRQGAGVEYRYPVETQEVLLRHGVVTETSATLFANERVLVRPGKDGLGRRYDYFEERWEQGKRLSRVTMAPPKGEPTMTVESAPATEVVAVGRRRGDLFVVAADDGSGQPIGRIPASGSLRFEVRGKVRFAQDGQPADAFGNSAYSYYHTPYRTDIAPGALLVRTGTGRWLGLKELPADGRTFVVRGKPNTPLAAVVNDATGYFDDNRGSFEVIVWREGTAP